MSIVALIGAALTIVGQLLAEYYKGAPERKRKTDALAAIELKETQDAMAVADRELERLSPTAKQPILLSPDDHL